MNTDRLDTLLSVKLRSVQLARELYNLHLDTEARVVEEVALHVQREIETTEQAATAQEASA